MNRPQIRKAVLAAIAEVCDQPEQWSDGLSDDLRPVGGIDAFDSYSAEEAIAAIGDALDIDFPLRFNPFIASERRRTNNITEIVDAIYQQAAQAQQVANG